MIILLYVEYNIRAPVLLNKTRCEIEIICSASLAFYLFSPTRLINSIKHEHSCKILYLFGHMCLQSSVYLQVIEEDLEEAWEEWEEEEEEEEEEEWE